MRTFVLTIALFNYGIVAAQQPVNVNEGKTLLTNQVMAGAPYSSTKYVSLVSGSPYLNEDWLPGSIITLDSTTFDNLNLKLDLNDNVIIYKNQKNEEMVSVAPVQTVRLQHLSSPLVFDQIDKVLYQRLNDGDTKLYKRYLKRIVESKAYASSVTEQKIVTEEQYFVKIATGLARIKKPKDLAELFPGKATEINQFISEKKLNGKKEADFVSLITFYNEISK